MKLDPQLFEYLTDNPDAALEELARRQFIHYLRYIAPHMLIGWWVLEVANRLQGFYKDLKNGKRPILLIQAPPQHGKSTIITYFLSWLAGKDPRLRKIYTAYSERLGIRANLQLQRIYDSTEYKKIFPNTALNSSNSVAASGQFLRNREVLEYVGKGGYFRNTTVRGSITGESLDIGVIDDPVKGREEANSPLIREKTWDWFTDDFLTRFSDLGGLLGIMTRWHPDDLFGRVQDIFGSDELEGFGGIDVYSRPAIAEDDEEHREIGEPLFPELKSLPYLLSRKKLMTASSWSSLYQQSPFLKGGGLFAIENFKIVNFTPELKGNPIRYWDKACLVSDTMVKTIEGEKCIKDVIKGDSVLTRAGYRKVTDSWLSKHTDELCSVVFSNGSIVTGTPDHKIFTKNRHWVDLQQITIYDVVLDQSEILKWKNKSSSLRVRGTFDTQKAQARLGGVITTITHGIRRIKNIKIMRYIGRFGENPTEIYPLATISTIKMGTGITTTSKTLSASNPLSIGGFMRQICLLKLPLLILSIEKKHLMLFSKKQKKSKLITAVSAVIPSMQRVLRLSFAKSVKRFATLGADESVEGVPVYDLSVDDRHEFFANGVLVHNCTEDGGAYTAGVKVSETIDGQWVVLDVVRKQMSPFQREKRIKQTAELDGKKTTVYVEEEGGSGGRESADSTVRNLAGFRVKKDRVTGSKEERAEPYAAQVEGGNILLLKADWNKDFLAEHELFPDGTYKDQCDAAAGAFNKLTSAPVIGFTEKQKQAINKRGNVARRPKSEKTW